MSAPGTKIVAEDVTFREIDGITVTQTVIHWNDTAGISVDYEANGTALWDDPVACTSHDDVLSDTGLRELLAEYDVIPRLTIITPADLQRVAEDALADATPEDLRDLRRALACLTADQVRHALDAAVREQLTQATRTGQ